MMRRARNQRFVINTTSNGSQFERQVKDAINELGQYGQLEFHYAQSDEYMSCLIICYL